jgi:carnosine N-methyltransferase
MCGNRFALCGGMPILLEDPRLVLARAQSAVRRGMASLERLRRSVAGVRWFPAERDAVRVRVLAGVERNQALVQRLEAYLPAEPLPEPEAVDASYQALEMVFPHAVQDWSGEPASEERIGAIESTIAGALTFPWLDRASAVVLGAGTCRVARDLTGPFEHVLAVDLSLPMALVYRALQDADAEYFDIGFQNWTEPADQVYAVQLSVARSAAALGEARPENLQLAVADAAALPVERASVGAVFSIYFTDVIPLPVLLPEVVRVLKGGGIFVHFGTLGYHRVEPRDMLSVSEVRRAFERAGFEIVAECSVPVASLGDRPGRLVSVVLRNWFFVARKVSSTTRTEME